MSKTKTLFTMALLVLLGSMGAAQAQAQDTYVTTEMVAQPRTAARMGGENEMSGSVWLTFSTATPVVVNRMTVTLHYSVPLAGDITSTAPGSMAFTSATATVMGMGEDGDNDDNGTVVISAIEGTSPTLVIRNVMLNVSEASGPVTVTAEIESSDDTDFLRFDGPNIGTVIDDIVIGVKAKADAGIVRTRGTDSGEVTATLTLEEAYTDAFMMGNELEIEFSDIPDEVTLTAEVTGIKSYIAASEDGETPAVIVADTDPYATVSAVKNGSATVMLGGGDMPEVEEGNSQTREAPDKVVLTLALTAASSNDKISFPLDVGEITVSVTFGGDDFDEAFTDPMAVFNIRSAQCELLFPVVSVLPNRGNWDTGISVTNPAYKDEMAAGGLTFTFYGLGGVVAMYDTTKDGVIGDGLEPDGTLLPGGTYQVMASQILAATEWGEMFRGHVYLKTDYTHCSGLGWVTDFMTVNQAYTATVIDADTGRPGID